MTDLTYIWLAISFLLLIIEMIIVPHFVLNFSMSALMMALLHYFDLINLSLVLEALIYGLITIIIIFPIRFILKNLQNTTDINEYN